MLTIQYVYSEEHQAGFIVGILNETEESLVLAKQGSYGLANRGWHSLQLPVQGDWNILEEVVRAYGLHIDPLFDTECINPHYRDTLAEHFKWLLKVQTESMTDSYYIYDYDTNTINTVSKT